MLLLDSDGDRRLQALTFMRSLKGHSLPPVCILTVLGWVCIIINTRPENWLDEPHIRAQINEGHNHMFRWVSLPRALADIRAIEKMLCKCNARGTNLETMVQDSNAMAHANGLHLWNNLRNDHGDPIIVTILQIAFSTFNKLWKDNNSNATRLPRLKRIQGRSQWPTSVQELLLHGPEDTVRGLLSWLILDFKYQHFHWMMSTSIFGLIRMAYPCAMPRIATSRLFLQRGIIGSIEYMYRDFLRVSEDPSAIESSLVTLSGFTREFKHLLLQCMDNVH
jgi:hypothetical protein